MAVADRPVPIINMDKMGHIHPEYEFRNSYERTDFIESLICFSQTQPPSEILFQASIRGVVEDILKREETAHLAPYYSLMETADKLIQAEDKEGFAFFLSTYKELIHKLPPDFLLYLICTHCAPGCATVFFESGFRVDITKNLLGYYRPLEYAAVHFSYDLTRILLDNGVDNSDPNDPFCHIEMAIARALQQLRCYQYFSDWDEDKSKFKLFYIMCIPDLKEPLDTIGLLASRCSKHTKKMLDVAVVSDITLTALLMSAPVKFLKPAPDTKLLEVAPDAKLLEDALDGVGVPHSLRTPNILMTTPFGQYFLKECAALVSLQRNELDDHYKSSRVKQLIHVYNVAKTLSRVIGVIDNYRKSPRVKIVPKHEIPYDIAADIINETEEDLFLFTQDVLCDDIDCLRPKLPSNGEGSTINAKDIAKQICKAHPWVTKANLGSSLKVEKPAMGASWFSSPAVLCAPYRKFHSCSTVEIRPPKTMRMKPPCNVSSLVRICAPLFQIVKRMK